MEELFSELTEILKQQQTIVKKMLEITETQNLALQQNDLKLLNEAVQQLNKVAVQMAGLDTQREKIQEKLTIKLSLKADVTARALIDQAPASLVVKLKTILPELNGDFGKLRAVNQLNEILTKRAMQVNTALLNIFNPDNKAVTYQAGGGKKEGISQLKVLNKTV
ncbi:flagellar protein FlgN [Peptococcaceae bacterium]|nr:flagellar protein FlgN [Peptococcaceae bacterium]